LHRKITSGWVNFREKEDAKKTPKKKLPFEERMAKPHESFEQYADMEEKKRGRSRTVRGAFLSTGNEKKGKNNPPKGGRENPQIEPAIEFTVEVAIKRANTLGARFLRKKNTSIPGGDRKKKKGPTRLLNRHGSWTKSSGDLFKALKRKTARSHRGKKNIPPLGKTRRLKMKPKGGGKGESRLGKTRPATTLNRTRVVSGHPREEIKTQ